MNTVALIHEKILYMFCTCTFPSVHGEKGIILCSIFHLCFFVLSLWLFCLTQLQKLSCKAISMPLSITDCKFSDIFCDLIVFSNFLWAFQQGIQNASKLISPNCLRAWCLLVLGGWVVCCICFTPLNVYMSLSCDLKTEIFYQIITIFYFCTPNPFTDLGLVLQDNNTSDYINVRISVDRLIFSHQGLGSNQSWLKHRLCCSHYTFNQFALFLSEGHTGMNRQVLLKWKWNTRYCKPGKLSMQETRQRSGSPVQTRMNQTYKKVFESQKSSRITKAWCFKAIESLQNFLFALSDDLISFLLWHSHQMKTLTYRVGLTHTNMYIVWLPKIIL